MLFDICKTFTRDQRGGGTILGLFWFMMLVGICGLAVDVTNGLRTKTMLQATADSAALAGVMELPDTGKAVTAAVNYSKNNMAPGSHGDVLPSGDVEVGVWDENTRTFLKTGFKTGFPSGTQLDAVRVSVHASRSNNNAVPVNFLRIIGLQSWDVEAAAVAQGFTPDCVRNGLIARNIVDISSNNAFMREICVHGQKGVHMQNHNYFEKGVVVSMIDDATLVIPSGGMTSNPGLPEALDEMNKEPRLVNQVSKIMSDMLNVSSGIMPSHVDVTKTVQVIDDKVNFLLAVPGTIYHAQCKPNKTMNIPSSIVLLNIVLIADCEVNIGSGATIINAVIASRSGTNKKEENANVSSAANVQLGLPDNCAEGGGVQIFSNASMHFSSSTRFDGVLLVAKGDIELGAQAMGVNGTSAQAGGDIKMTSNN